MLESYQAVYSPDSPATSIGRAVRSTQAIVQAQNATFLGVGREEVAKAVGDMPVDEALVEEIDLGLSRMVITWILDFARAAVEPTRATMRGDVSIIVGIPQASTQVEALTLLALEAIRKPRWGAEAAASLISHPPTAAELRRAASLVELADLALFAEVPTAEMLRAVDVLTGRKLYTPTQRRERATATQERLARRTVTQTQATASKVVQTSLGIELYAWVSQRDARVRPLHVKLDGESRGGKFFNWSSPDTHGEGNPGDPYGCRCVAVPVVNGKPIVL